jgi:hypothetical protein
LTVPGDERFNLRDSVSIKSITALGKAIYQLKKNIPLKWISEMFLKLGSHMTNMYRERENMLKCEQGLCALFSVIQQNSTYFWNAPWIIRTG